MSDERPNTIIESLEQSLKEMKLIREGKLPKRTLEELDALCEQWVEEVENEE
jgi:hypothetical protein